jgi:hypothetical protein
VLHRHLLDEVWLGNEVLDDEEDDEGQDECLDDLEQTPERALTHKSGSIGGADWGRPCRSPAARKFNETGCITWHPRPV